MESLEDGFDLDDGSESSDRIDALDEACAFFRSFSTVRENCDADRVNLSSTACLGSSSSEPMLPVRIPRYMNFCAPLYQNRDDWEGGRNNESRHPPPLNSNLLNNLIIVE